MYQDLRWQSFRYLYLRFRNLQFKMFVSSGDNNVNILGQLNAFYVFLDCQNIIIEDVILYQAG